MTAPKTFTHYAYEGDKDELPVEILKSPLSYNTSNPYVFTSAEVVAKDVDGVDVTSDVVATGTEDVSGNIVSFVYKDTLAAGTYILYMTGVQADGLRRTAKGKLVILPT